MIRPLLIFFIWLSVSTSPALSRQLVADLSSDEVSITTDFTGQNLLLFGAVSNVDTTAIAGRESDIIVILTGPTLPLSSRKKERVSGIWINTQTVQWRNAPSFYHILSSRPLSQILSDDKLKELRIGYQHLGLKSKNPNDTPQKIADWQESLSRNMTAQNLWQVDEKAVSIIRNALFRAPVSLPANITPGEYEVRILDVRDGQLVAEDKREITVQKAGLGALIYRVAHEYSVFYGLFAVAFAVAAGWIASVAFRRN